MADNLDQVNVFNPAGEVVKIPKAQLPLALGSGQYQQASSDDVDSYLKEQKYGGPLEQAKTALEGAASAATFGGSTAIETETGLAKPEDIQARRETNPVSYGVGQTAGLIGSNFIPGVGEAADIGRVGAINPLSAQSIMTGAGKGVAEGLGLTGENALHRIGSAAVQNAVETGLFQAGDEVSKNFSQDPNQTGQTALLNTGLGALFGAGLGGTIGAVSPTWKAMAGEKMGGLLETFQKRLNGEPISLPSEVQGAVDSAGIPIPPEVRAGLSQNPKLQRSFNILQESKTDSGLALKDTLNDFHKNAADGIVSALGEDPATVATKGEISHFDAGSNIKESVAKQIEDNFAPIKEAYNGFKEKFSQVPAQQEANQIAEKVGSLINDERWNLSESSPELKLANEVLKDIPNIKNLSDLAKYQSLIWSKAKINNQWNAAGKLVGILREAESNLMEKAASLEGTDVAAQMNATRKAYGQYSGLLDDLNSRLHVGKYKGPDSFVENLREMKPEDVLRRMTNAKDAGLLDLMEKEFPEASGMAKNYHVKNLLAQAATKAPEGYSINSKTFLSKFNELSPELKKYILPQGAEQKINGIQSVLDYLPKNRSSGTPGNADSLWSYMPGSVMAAVSMLTGHSPLMGAILGQVGKLAGRDAPDAIRLAMLKFLGNDKEINAPAMKAMIDFVHNTIQGQNLLSNGAKAVFESGRIVLPAKLIPDDKSREKLDDRLKEMQTDPQALFETGGQLVHYLPDHGQALSQTAAQGVQYLNSIRPNPVKQHPLDEDQKPSAIQKDKFDRALDIAQQPLLIYQHIKDGTIIPEDVINLKSINPNMYKMMNEKLIHTMTEHIEKDNDIPYQTRLGLSLFLGQSMDSTMTPQAIQATQMVPATNNQTAQPGQPQQRPKHSMAKIGQIASSNQTAGQAREAQKLKMN